MRADEMELIFKLVLQYLPLYNKPRFEKHCVPTFDSDISAIPLVIQCKTVGDMLEIIGGWYSDHHHGLVRFRSDKHLTQLRDFVAPYVHTGLWQYTDFDLTTFKRQILQQLGTKFYRSSDAFDYAWGLTATPWSKFWDEQKLRYMTKTMLINGEEREVVDLTEDVELPTI
jgi:hypothetical protein